MAFTARLLLLGSGELGREFAISAKRLGAHVTACDSYANAPAMQVADAADVFSMLDAGALRAAIARHRPDIIVPEVEAIRTEVLEELEAQGQRVAPSARAAALTMNRDRIRDFAASLGLPTSRFAYAASLPEAEEAARAVGYPCVVKPVMSSSGKGQSTVHAPEDLAAAFHHATTAMRGDRPRVIVEAFVAFDYEITLLTVASRSGLRFCPPIGHRQEKGDYRESWQPASMHRDALAAAQRMAATIVPALVGPQGVGGIFGVEFFVTGRDVLFSELSPRPHDTGMVTLVSQHLSEFDLHARALLGLPIPEVALAAPAAASAVILADRDSTAFRYEGLADALATPADRIDVRLFGKPGTRPGRRMGVALATGETVREARLAASEAARRVTIRYAG